MENLKWRRAIFFSVSPEEDKAVDMGTKQQREGDLGRNGNVPLEERVPSMGGMWMFHVWNMDVP